MCAETLTQTVTPVCTGIFPMAKQLFHHVFHQIVRCQLTLAKFNIASFTGTDAVLSMFSVIAVLQSPAELKRNVS